MDSRDALEWSLVFLVLSLAVYLLAKSSTLAFTILQIKEAYIIEEPKKQQNQTPIFIRRS